MGINDPIRMNRTLIMYRIDFQILLTLQFNTPKAMLNEYSVNNDLSGVVTIIIFIVSYFILRMHREHINPNSSSIELVVVILLLQLPYNFIKIFMEEKLYKGG